VCAAGFGSYTELLCFGEATFRVNGMGELVAR